MFRWVKNPKQMCWDGGFENVYPQWPPKDVNKDAKPLMDMFFDTEVRVGLVDKKKMYLVYIPVQHTIPQPKGKAKVVEERVEFVLYRNDGIVILQSVACSPHGHPVLTLGHGDACHLRSRFLCDKFPYTRNLPVKAVITDVPWGKTGTGGASYPTDVPWPAVVESWAEIDKATMKILENMKGMYFASVSNWLPACMADIPD